MKKTLLSFAALAALLAPLPAKEYKLPKEKSVFSVNFPEKWEVTHEDEAVTGVSSDGAVQIYAQTDDAQTIEDSVKECIEYLVGEGVKLDIDSQHEEDGEHNGMKMGSIGWKGTDKDGDCTVSLIFLNVSEDTTMTLIYWATDSEVKKHKKDILGIIDSMKSLAKKGKKAAKKPAKEEEEAAEEEE